MFSLKSCGLLSVVAACHFSTLSAEPLFKLGDKSFEEKDLTPAIKQMLFDAGNMAHMQKERILDQALIQMYVKQTAEKKKKSEAEVEAELMTAKPVTEDDAKKWYEENKNRLQGREFALLKNEIMSLLTRERQMKSQEELVAKIKKEEKFVSFLKAPTAPVMEIKTDGYPSKGAANPKVTIIEFADYSCGHCQHAAGNLKQVVEQFKDKVKLVFIDFPLNPQSLSVSIAQGAHCAGEQNKFWEYHYDAFADQANFTKETPSKIAKKLGLDEKKFATCLTNDSIKQKILASRQQGDELGVNATPAIYLNGQKVDSYEFSELAARINKML